ncbi:MAG: DUF4410 domain-containing protein [Geobacteraceae bacterium]|nr:DUF4410 domain-containing protein [Geobacteraceae bacterium]
MARSVFGTSHSIPVLLAVLAISSIFAAVSTAGEIAKKITGEVKVQSRVDEARQPSSAPSVIYVQDFDLGYDTTQAAEKKGPPVIGRVMSRVTQRNDPRQKAAKLVELMSGSLVKGFTEQKIDARRCIPGAPIPSGGWLIRGVFTEVDQGKRVVRAAIGFGAGATAMELYVSVSDLAENPDAPFIIFGTEKDPNRIPGAVVTMNPYVAAAKFVMEKNASERDVKKTAKEIVSTIVKYMGTLGVKGETAPR